MKNEATHNEQIEHLADLISGINICMLTTIDGDGKPWSRPMGTQATEFTPYARLRLAHRLHNQLGIS